MFGVGVPNPIGLLLFGGHGEADATAPARRGHRVAVDGEPPRYDHHHYYYHYYHYYHFALLFYDVIIIISSISIHSINIRTIIVRLLARLRSSCLPLSKPMKSEPPTPTRAPDNQFRTI